MPQPSGIGIVYGDQVAFDADLTAWEDEKATRAVELKRRKAAQDQQRDRTSQRAAARSGWRDR
eukprot:2565874-Prymnesium_polylepis.1